jgi:cytochrome c biogenesis protein CcmG/thiol:disulfide interchange protein DsbE
MRARLLGAPLMAVLLSGCVNGTGADATSLRTATTGAGRAIATAAECEELPDGRAVRGNETLPRLTLPCLGPGPAVPLDHLTGRPTLVNLWATWCGPCREEMPLLQDAFAGYGRQIRFLGVDTQDDPGAAAAFAENLGVGYPHVVDPDGRLLTALGVRGLPVTLAVDGHGQIVARSVGQLSADELQALMERLLT